MASLQPIALPFTRAPYDNELITSWLARIAAIYHTTWNELLGQYPLEDLRNIGDYRNTQATFVALGTVTRTDPQIIRSIDLAVRFPGHPATRFLCNPRTRLTAPDFCPQCLKEDFEADRDNYFRCEWAVAGVTHCQIHRTNLSSTCDNCMNFRPHMVMRGKQFVLYCGRCRVRLLDYFMPLDTGQNEPELRDEVISFEKTILASLHGKGNPKRDSVTLIEDLAFLIFYYALPWSNRYIKEELGSWHSYPARMSRAMRLQRTIHSASWTYPMSTTVVKLRWPIAAAAIAMSLRRQKITLFGPRLYPIEASLPVLYEYLDDAGREEMVFRANSWPREWREQVKRLINTPHPEAQRWHNREPWAVSSARRVANHGRIPKYSHF